MLGVTFEQSVRCHKRFVRECEREREIERARERERERDGEKEGGEDASRIAEFLGDTVFLQAEGGTRQTDRSVSRRKIKLVLLSTRCHVPGPVKCSKKQYSTCQFPRFLLEEC